MSLVAHKPIIQTVAQIGHFMTKSNQNSIPTILNTIFVIH